MKHTLPIQKSRAVELLGGSSTKAAAVLQYAGRSSVEKWPETLSHRDSLMVLGALWLQQLERQPTQKPVTLTWGAGIVRLMRDGRSA